MYGEEHEKDICWSRARSTWLGPSTNPTSRQQQKPTWNSLTEQTRGFLCCFFIFVYWLRLEIPRLTLFFHRRASSDHCRWRNCREPTPTRHHTVVAYSHLRARWSGSSLINSQSRLWRRHQFTKTFLTFFSAGNYNT